jgi:hypothetical protein
LITGGVNCGELAEASAGEVAAGAFAAGGCSGGGAWARRREGVRHKTSAARVKLSR